ncbi:TadE/TadG family type IV pilus assembly protein [Veronia pacifica]|uniref:Pilus assembly protein TadG n=1 Tax=Veronia pacifica TaxID=1080227 RepID=A0A1C3ES70_9GAMM|nr:TadE/TadG family type IV pilus assembly protein [Veronia pacifica]ODA36074.1 hypothetical protein A8L45_00260 [Veronia pacifica]
MNAVNTYRKVSPRRQRGAAAVSMAISLVAMIGAVFFAIEATRYIQTQSRLGDAAEAAAFALSSADNQPREQALAREYIRQYLPDETSIPTLNIERKTVKYEEQTKRGREEREYLQHKVTVTSQHASWFYSGLIPSFDRSQSLTNQALARRYPEYLAGKPIDIVFVTDHSGSMNDYGKLRTLKQAVGMIRDIILNNEDAAIDSRMAYVPFSFRTIEERNGERLCQTHVKYNHSYNSADWFRLSSMRKWKVNYCAKTRQNCDGVSWQDAREAVRYGKYLDPDDRWTIYPMPDPKSVINYRSTVSNWYSTSPKNLALNANKSYLFSEYSCAGRRFHTIPLTGDQDKFQFDSFQAYGGTAAYQGLIRGAQILKEGKPHSSASPEEKAAYRAKHKMILVLSDGEESNDSKVFENLVNNGLCAKIREDINEDSETDLFIGVIGIGFQATRNNAFINCADEVKDVKRLKDLSKIIEELIRSGVSQQGTSRLHYRYLDDKRS